MRCLSCVWCLQGTFHPRNHGRKASHRGRKAFKTREAAVLLTAMLLSTATVVMNANARLVNVAKKQDVAPMAASYVLPSTWGSCLAPGLAQTMPGGDIIAGCVNKDVVANGDTCAWPPFLALLPVRAAAAAADAPPPALYHLLARVEAMVQAAWQGFMVGWLAPMQMQHVSRSVSAIVWWHEHDAGSGDMCAWPPYLAMQPVTAAVASPSLEPYPQPSFAATVHAAWQRLFVRLLAVPKLLLSCSLSVPQLMLLNAVGMQRSAAEPTPYAPPFFSGSFCILTACGAAHIWHGLRQVCYFGYKLCQCCCPAMAGLFHAVVAYGPGHLQHRFCCAMGCALVDQLPARLMAAVGTVYDTVCAAAAGACMFGVC